MVSPGYLRGEVDGVEVVFVGWAAFKGFWFPEVEQFGEGQYCLPLDISCTLFSQTEYVFVRLGA